MFHFLVGAVDLHFLRGSYIFHLKTTFFLYFDISLFTNNFRSKKILKGSDRQCLVVELRMQYYGDRINLRNAKCFSAFSLLSLSAKLTFKIIYLGGYVLRIDCFKLLNNDDEKCIKNSTVIISFLSL